MTILWNPTRLSARIVRGASGLTGSSSISAPAGTPSTDMNMHDEPSSKDLLWSRSALGSGGVPLSTQFILPSFTLLPLTVPLIPEPNSSAASSGKLR